MERDEDKNNSNISWKSWQITCYRLNCNTRWVAYAYAQDPLSQILFVTQNVLLITNVMGCGHSFVGKREGVQS